ncbi:MAG TPA: transcriptional regulator NrdR [Candidatus Nitrosocosmicus sp.]|nr:transcriptional regulator NrdR [Candidatus Nitrosocosmicus sp.]
MNCIFCSNKDTDVCETRVSDDGSTVRRRRECGKCFKRFTTYERVEQLPIIVIKSDSRREKFDRDKLKKGILKSTGKTAITLSVVEKIVMEVESDLKQEESQEIESRKIGELVAERLKKIDKVAYIRFASVFRRFVDIETFEKELKKLG